MTIRFLSALSVAVCLLAFSNSYPHPLSPTSSELELFAKLLDANGDGEIGAFESAGRMLLLAQEASGDDGKLSVDEFLSFAKEQTSGRQGPINQMEEIRGEVDELFKDLAPGGTAKIKLSKLDKILREELKELDANKDGLLERDEVLKTLQMEFRSASFHVVKDRAIMSGTIDGSTPGAVLRLILEHPQVRLIEMQNVPGSADDHSNLFAASLVRKHGFDIHLADGAEIASGGVDFFCAGNQRTIGKGAKIGVHSWAEGENGTEGGDLPKDHPGHQMFLDFYRTMGIPTEFYWFTLKAASAEDIHWMKPEEISKFKLGRLPKLVKPKDPSYGLDKLDVHQSSRNILKIPQSVHPEIRKTFDRYTRVVAPNGKPIHILAQAGWPDDGIVRARNILGHFLTDVPGSKFGADKSNVANAMADRRATLTLFLTETDMERAFHGGVGRLNLAIQDLRANECPIEGTKDYMLHQTRDAAYEEILHLVLDYGIRPALPHYDALLQEANLAAAKKLIWEPEDEAEFHRNEYFAVTYDNFLDLWKVKPKLYEGLPLQEKDLPTGTSHFGQYRANSRRSLKAVDPRGFELLHHFLPDHLTYEPTLPKDFTGTFSILLDPQVAYTVKSQHLRSVRLSGVRDANLIGNEHANELRGNAGINRLTGGGGNDFLDGMAGLDTAIFRGKISDYKIATRNGMTIVTDTQVNRDGKDRLKNVEFVEFADGHRVQIR